MPDVNVRFVLNTIFWILTYRARWKDVPKDPRILLQRATAHGRLQRWKKEGVFDRILMDLLKTITRRKTG